MRKACRTELQVFCSESLRAWGIIDFPKSVYTYPLGKEKKSVFAQNQDCYHIMKTSMKEEVKRSIIHPAASFTQILCILCKERKRIPSKKPE